MPVFFSVEKEIMNHACWKSAAMAPVLFRNGELLAFNHNPLEMQCGNYVCLELV